MSTRSRNILQLAILESNQTKINQITTDEVPSHSKTNPISVANSNETTSHFIQKIPTDDELFSIIEEAEVIFEDDLPNILENKADQQIIRVINDDELNQMVESPLLRDVFTKDLELASNNILSNKGDQKYHEKHEEEIEEGHEKEVEEVHEKEIDGLHDEEIEEEELTQEKENVDPDFELDESSDEQEDNENEISDRESTGEVLEESVEGSTGRKRKRMNKRALNKKRRMLGQNYLGFTKPAGQVNTFHNAPRGERIIKDRCHCVRKTKTKKCSEVKERNRNQIFEYFWKKTNWDQRKQYVCGTVKKVDVKRPKFKDGNQVPRRTATLVYSLPIGASSVPVCKTMYLNTLCLGEWSVKNWVETSMHGMNESTEYKTTKRPKKHDNFKEQKALLNQFLEQLNKLPSHYCRKDTSKLYLEQSFQSYEQLYNEYIRYCGQNGKKPLSKSMLMESVRSLNISIFIPRKDQCNDCFKFKSGNLSQQDYDKHVSLKNRARAEKEADKESAKSGNCTTLTMDVQAVKLCPSIPANALYYKTKLNCHNFTVYDIATHECTCYWYDEITADGQAAVYASFLVNFLEEKYLSNEHDKKPIVIYSDGCTAQNRNCVLANALLYLSEKHSIRITQKFLVKGHTQMECDSVHSSIEKALKNKEIYVPYDYVTVTTQARKKHPYLAKKPSSDFFLNYGYKPLLKYDSIRPGKTVSDPAVTDLRVLQYHMGNILYKLDFDTKFQELPRRPRNINNFSCATFPKLFPNPLPITERKFKDLQDIKSVIPKDFWSFYDGILHK